MTPDELRELCQSKKVPLAFADAFSDLDEAGRRVLSKTIQDVYREARKAEQADGGQVTYRGSLARLALLACCPWSQAVSLLCASFSASAPIFPTAPLLSMKQSRRAGSWDMSRQGREKGPP